MDTTINILQEYLIAPLAYIVSAFIIFLIGKIMYQVLHPKINVKDELVEQDNFAFAIAHTGYFIGLLLAIGSTIVGPSNGLITDIMDMFIYGLLAIILLNLSSFINYHFILSKFNVHKEIIVDKNEGTGLVEAANAIVSGLIIFGAVSGESANIWQGILSSVVFWLVGQIIMVLTTRIYNAITPYDIHEHIEKDNVAVGLGFAGAMIAIANLIRFALMGDFESWGSTFSDLGIDVGIGLLLLPIMRLISDKVLLPGRKLSDEIVHQEKPNLGAGLIEAFSYISSSILLTWCL